MNKMNLACPMPQLDFDRITLGHGSGGLLTHKLLEAGVFDLLDNEYLQTRHDGAMLQLNGPTAFTTDSFVISPIFFPGGNIGELAVNGTVNDLAMCGAIPKFISLGLILEEGLMMEELWQVLVSISNACKRAGVVVVTGDTKVVEKGKGDKVFINTTGIGSLHPHAKIGIENIKAGDKMIVSGSIATHGMAIMSIREGLEFDTSITSDTAALNHLVKDLLDQFGEKAHLFRDPTRGGVATVLNEIAQQAKLGVELWQEQLPIDEQVGSACEILGLDPLYVANEGIFLCIADAASAEEMVDTMRKDELGKNAVIIGEISENHPRQVVLQSGIGGKRIVSMPAGDQLPRIC
ncbi:hydrogenase expression/formation protein HypE [Catalinimonas sp. 4WD22]|uniref:hydrogenase expression/formation protein HypE n=1 Tax=Catalinimonas locisalis TaxID=3133978 RepID=UPI003100F868